MSPESTPLPAEKRLEIAESQPKPSSSLLQRMKNMAASTRGRMAAAILALGGAVEAANKAEAATMRAAEVVHTSQATEIGDDEFAFIWDNGQLRISNLEDNSNRSASWVGTHSLDSTEMDFSLPLQGTTPVPDRIIGPSGVPGDGIQSPDYILDGQLQAQEDFFMAVSAKENGNFASIDEYLEGGKIYIGMSPIQGDPQNIDEALAMTSGDVYEADIPDILNQLELYVIRPLQVSGPTADFNGNGVVDAADYTVWMDNFGNQSATQALGDADGDSDVDGADYLEWQRQFGTSAASAASTSSTPEPSTLALGLSAAAAAAMARRRKNKKK